MAATTSTTWQARWQILFTANFLLNVCSLSGIGIGGATRLSVGANADYGKGSYQIRWEAFTFTLYVFTFEFRFKASYINL